MTGKTYWIVTITNIDTGDTRKLTDTRGRPAKFPTEAAARKMRDEAVRHMGGVISAEAVKVIDAPHAITEEEAALVRRKVAEFRAKEAARK